MVDFNKVKVDVEDGVAVLTLNHPEVMNAISIDMLEGLIEAFDFIEDRANGVRCVVMSGQGKGFCAGANLQGRNTAKPKSGGAGAVLESHYHPLLRRMRRLHCPMLTAINGAAAGAGMSLALMGDLKLAAKSAYFLQAFRRIGLVPDAGSTWMLPRLVGAARAMELSLLAEKLPAAKALDWGLINRVYEDAELMSEAKKMAKELASGPTVSLALIRGLYWDSPENTFEEQLDLEFRTQRVAGATADFKEGVTAFLEKRPAKFKGA
ncbi:MAG TPA: enoyl-CoA hydratase/isomerase [Rhodoblastus sp.]|nr:enoyl-CoA hydratase/isomerase [Rhodoblastus sp.]